MKPAYLLIPILALAVVVSFIVKPMGFNLPKLAGIGLALIAFLPVFILIRKSIGDDPESANRLLGVFIGGFFFKLLVVLIGVWVGVSRLKWSNMDFVVPCLVFLFSLQVFESVYFWGKGRQ